MSFQARCAVAFFDPKCVDVLSGSGARSTPSGVLPAELASAIDTFCRRGVCMTCSDIARARYRGGCAAGSAPQDLDGIGIVLIESECAVSAPVRHWREIEIVRARVVVCFEESEWRWNYAKENQLMVVRI